LERDDAATALDIYRDVLAPAINPAPPLNVMSDSAGLLWRLSTYGHAVPGDLWRDAQDYATRYFPKSSLPFADVHMALLAAATGDDGALDERLRAIEQRLADGKLPAGAVVPQICRAVRAFAAGDARGCVALLEPVLGDVVRVGGSHAQREIIEDTFIVALIRAGELPRAREQLDRRLHRRPSLRDTRWRAAAARAS
jgi:hypothetical protein